MFFYIVLTLPKPFRKYL